MVARNYVLPVHPNHILNLKLDPVNKFVTWSEFPIVHRITKSRSPFHRAVWVLALVFCWILSSYQVWDRVTYYLSEPIWTSVTVVRNNSLYYPSMTGCIDMFLTKEILRMCNDFVSRQRLNPSNYRLRRFLDLDKLGLYHEMNYTELTQLAVQGQDVQSNCKSALAPTEWISEKIACAQRSFANLPLSCLTIRHNRPVPVYSNRKLFRGLYWKSANFKCQDSNNDRTIGVLIHDPIFDNGWIQWKYMIDEDIMEFNYENETEMIISLSTTKFFYLNTARNPCIDDETYLKCFQKYVNIVMKKAEITCSLPNFGRRELNICQNTSSAWLTLFEINKSLRENKFSCPRRCQETLYRRGIRKITRHRYSNFLVSVTFLDSIVSLSKESYVYGLVALLCDIGGNVGLFLGVSLVSLFEVTEACCVQCVILRKRKRRVKHF